MPKALSALQGCVSGLICPYKFCTIAKGAKIYFDIGTFHFLSPLLVLCNALDRRYESRNILYF